MNDARHLPTVALCGFPDGVAGAARAQLVGRVAIASFAGPELLERIGGYSPSCLAWVLHALEDRVDLGPMMRTTVPVALVAPVDRPVLGAYLRLVEAKTARLFPYQRQSWEVLPELCSWLDGLLAGLTSADLVRLLLDADPALQRCEPIVRCLLAAPHSVRRPADVARAVGMWPPRASWDLSQQALLTDPAIPGGVTKVAPWCRFRAAVRSRCVRTVALAVVASCDAPADLEHQGLPVFEAGNRRVIHQSEELALPAVSSVVGDHLVVIDPAADATILVLNRFDGVLLRSFGRNGEGPGEFRTAWSIDAPSPAEGFWVYDITLSRSTYIDIERLLLHPDSVEPRIMNLRAEAYLTGPVWTSEGSILSPGFLGDHRLVKLDNNGVFVAEVGPTPVGDTLIPISVRHQIHQGMTVGNPSHDRVVVASSFVPRIEVFDSEGTLLTVAEVPFEWDIRADDLSSLEGFAVTPDMRLAYMMVAAADDWFFGLFSGRVSGGREGMERAISGEYVHVFDWTGRFVGYVHLETDAMSISVDPEATTLYVLEHDPLPAVSAYSLVGPGDGREE